MATILQVYTCNFRSASPLRNVKHLIPHATVDLDYKIQERN